MQNFWMILQEKGLISHITGTAHQTLPVDDRKSKHFPYHPSPAEQAMGSQYMWLVRGLDHQDAPRSVSEAKGLLVQGVLIQTLQFFPGLSSIFPPGFSSKMLFLYRFFSLLLVPCWLDIGIPRGLCTDFLFIHNYKIQLAVCVDGVIKKNRKHQWAPCGTIEDSLFQTSLPGLHGQEIWDIVHPELEIWTGLP